MKKIALCVLATTLMLSVISDQIKAATNNETTKTAIIAREKDSHTDQISGIKSIELTSISTSENKEILKETDPILDEKGRSNGRYNNRPSRREVDLSIQADRGYRLYIGGSGLLILILILVLVL